MADKKISELTSMLGADTASDDFFIVVDTSGSATRKISRAELNNAIEQDVLAQVDITSANIDGGTIDNTPIGGTTASTGNFTTVDVTGAVTMGGATTSADINFGDNDKAVFGAGNDLQIYHDGSNSYVEDTATGNLYLKTNGTNIAMLSGADIMAVFAKDDAVTLYHNNSLKFATTATGVDVQGSLTADGLTVDGDANIDATVPILRLDSPATAWSGGEDLGGVDWYTKDTSGSGPAVMARIYSESSGANTLPIPNMIFQTSLADVALKDRMQIAGNGDISFYADDGTTQGLFWDASAESLGLGTSSPSANLHVDASAPEFRLSQSGTAKVRLRTSGDNYINTGQNLGIGDASPDRKLHVNSGTSNVVAKFESTDSVAAIEFTDSAGSAEIGNEGNDLVFYPAGTEHMRINSSGDLLVGTGTAITNANLQVAQGSAGHFAGYFKNQATAHSFGVGIDSVDGTNLWFYFNGAYKGRVGTSASGTSYLSTSDYRLKENVVDMTGAITRVKSLQPKRFNFIADDSTTVDGFMAHEAATVVPEAVTGTHNEVDADGNPVYQGIDQAKLVPLLTAALQEAIAKIETLENKVTALEGN